jgi:aminoglycoside/choline kinase family phosphotransferase
MKRLENLFIKTFNKPIDTIIELKAHSSKRKIYRIKSNGFSCIGISNKMIEENKAFLQFSIALKSIHLKVPLIYNYTNNFKYYLEEDLGDFTLYEFIRQTKPSDNDKIKHYKHALKDLIDFQLKGTKAINFNYCYQTEIFDKVQISVDMIKYQKYFAKKFVKQKKGNQEFKALIEYFKKTVTHNQNLYFMYRDFQPRNIMVVNGDLYYIDYQSGRKGPLQYDLSSFLYSGSIDVNHQQRAKLFEYYLKEISKRISFDKGLFIKNFHTISIIRLLQMLGSYGYSYSITGKKLYLIKSIKAIDNIGQIIPNIKNISLVSFLKRLDDAKESITHILKHQ